MSISIILSEYVPCREYTSPSQISVTTKIAVLQWVRTLHSHVPNKINSQHQDIFPAVIRTVSDPCDGVVVLSIQLLAAMCMQNSDQDKTNFENFLRSLIAKFKDDEKLLDRRCSFIIQTLCTHVDSEKVFCTLARLLVEETDIVFTALLVQYLNWILLTSPNLAPLRDTLKSQRNNPKLGKKGSTDGRAVFSTLYTTWCHDPVSTIALCMIAHSYQHASDVIHALGEYEMTEMTLSGLDKLVQLLESPVFSALRLELVQPDTNPELFRSLAGILMLLPQSEAFTLLRNRLECVGVVRAAERTSQASSDLVDDKTLKDMLQHFNIVQAQHAIKNLKLSESQNLSQQ
ncbi:protein VAC14 homolog [Bolinopsis microptera]|uniref:protein VAC14 homolog n=1 Tax=Bolinopsis microptera TaxID=2820187 RepID=UPI00307A1E19